MALFTTVEHHISAAHDVPGRGVHGHTWSVRVTWAYNGEDAEHLKQRLVAALDVYDHTILPPELARAESFAQKLGYHLDAYRVEIWRGPEGLGAEWRA